MTPEDSLLIVWDTLHALRDGDRYDWDRLTEAMDFIAVKLGYTDGTIEFLEGKQ